MESQQEQTFVYFNEHAKEWRLKALGDFGPRVNITKQRNDYVTDVAKTNQEIRRTLDIGCGSGELVADLLEAGFDAYGIDFAPEMIEIAAKAYAANADRFQCASVFEYSPAGKFDLISANGFIEYISLEQFLKFLQLAKSWLNPEGRIVLGSRNRLFNIFSLNYFTTAEIEAGALQPLFMEANAIAQGMDASKLHTLETVKVQDNFHQHPVTGVKVDTRLQYTPAQLAKILHEAGYVAEGLGIIHYQGLPNEFKKKNPQFHAGFATTVQELGSHDVSLLPFSSSFMIHAQVK